MLSSNSSIYLDSGQRLGPDARCEPSRLDDQDSPSLLCGRIVARRGCGDGFPGLCHRTDGAWATDAALCDEVFTRTRKGKQLAFAELSDLYGSGFIIENTRIRGKSAKCTIKSKKEDSASLELQAACATQIMNSDVQFNLKVIDDNSMARRFPGMPGMEVIYHRCAF